MSTTYICIYFIYLHIYGGCLTQTQTIAYAAMGLTIQLTRLALNSWHMTGVLFQPTSSEIIDIRHYTWLFDFLWDFISLFYEYECLPECLSAPHARDAGGVQNPADALGLEVQMTVTCHMGTGELNPGVLEEQPLNSSLSHLILFFLSLPSSLLSLSSLPPFLSVWYREPNPEPYTC